MINGRASIGTNQARALQIVQPTRDKAAGRVWRASPRSGEGCGRDALNPGIEGIRYGRDARIEILIEVKLCSFRPDIRSINHKTMEGTLQPERPFLVIRVNQVADHESLRIQGR